MEQRQQEWDWTGGIIILNFNKTNFINMACPHGMDVRHNACFSCKLHSAGSPQGPWPFTLLMSYRAPKSSGSNCFGCFTHAGWTEGVIKKRRRGDTVMYRKAVLLVIQYVAYAVMSGPIPKCLCHWVNPQRRVLVKPCPEIAPTLADLKASVAYTADWLLNYLARFKLSWALVKLK